MEFPYLICEDPADFGAQVNFNVIVDNFKSPCCLPHFDFCSSDSMNLVSIKVVTGPEQYEFRWNDRITKSSGLRKRTREIRLHFPPHPINMFPIGIIPFGHRVNDKLAQLMYGVW